MAKSKKQTKNYKSCIWFHSPDNCLWPLWRGDKPQRRKKTPEHSGVVSTHISYFRGPTLPDWFRNTETLDEVSDLLDLCVRCDEVVNKPTYNAKAIEGMVRSRVNRFRRADTKLPAPPKSEKLISWQEWFTGLKAKPTTTDTNGGQNKEVPWDDDNKDYTYCVEAVKYAAGSYRKLSKSQLSILLRKPDCPIRHMRKKKPIRVKVHFEDLGYYIKHLPRKDISLDDIPDLDPKALAELAADAAAQKKQAAQEAQKIRRKEQGQKIISGNLDSI